MPDSNTSADTVAAEPDEPTVGPRAARATDRLVRTNNLAIFVLVAGGLAATAYVQTTHINSEPPSFLWILTTLRVVAPLAALALTGVFTSAAVSRYLRANPDLATTPEEVADVFYRCKLRAILLLGAAGVFADVGLLFGHRTLDILLAAVPLILLFMARVGPTSTVVFASFIEERRRETNG